MLRLIRSTGSAAKSKEIEGKVSGDSVVSNLVDGGETTNLTKRKNQAKTTKSKIMVKFKSHDFPKSRTEKAGTGFFTPKVRPAFTQLRQVFVKAPILHHFDLKSHIWIEINAPGYAIGGVLSQLSSRTRSDGVITKTNLGQWHQVAFFSKKKIPAETPYKTHDGKLLAIVETFKTWQYYLESCKHEIFVLTDWNNLCCFINIKNLSSRQVRWAQELFCYYFRIDYWQGKADGAADALSQYPQKNAKE